jgi:hypothetical protein
LVTVEAVTAMVAGDMMGDKNAVARSVAFDSLSNVGDLAGDLMSEYQRRLFKTVPFHYVCATDPARPYAYQQFPSAD